MFDNFDFDAVNRHLYYDPLIAASSGHFSGHHPILETSISSTTSGSSYCLYDDLDDDFDDGSKLEEDGSDTSCFSSNGSDQENKR